MKSQEIPADISIKRILELFDVHWGEVKPKLISNIVLDLNSTFNTICRVSGLASYGVEKYLMEINHMLRDFIQSNLDKKIYILYNTEKTYLKEQFGENYLDFFYDKRPKVADEIFTMFTSKLEQLSKLSNIRVINCGKFEPAILIFTLLTYDSNTLIMSRNMTVLQLIQYGGYFWDGRFLYNKELNPRNIHSIEFPKTEYKLPVELPFSLYSYYLCMRGMPNHGFEGVHGMGPKKTIDYIQANLKNIIDETDAKFNYEDYKYFCPSEFILKVVTKDDKIKEGYRVFRDKILGE